MLKHLSQKEEDYHYDQAPCTTGDARFSSDVVCDSALSNSARCGIGLEHCTNQIGQTQAYQFLWRFNIVAAFICDSLRKRNSLYEADNHWWENNNLVMTGQTHGGEEDSNMRKTTQKLHNQHWSRFAWSHPNMSIRKTKSLRCCRDQQHEEVIFSKTVDTTKSMKQK